MKIKNVSVFLSVLAFVSFSLSAMWPQHWGQQSQPAAVPAQQQWVQQSQRQPVATAQQPAQAQPIQFGGRTRMYPEFESTYPVSVNIGDYSWPSTEAYYQAAKKSLSQDQFYAMTSSGATVNEQYMEKAQRAKFAGNAQLKKLLLGTGNAPLHFAVADRFWGFPGQNKLGLILMKIRGELQAQAAPAIAQQIAPAVLAAAAVRTAGALPAQRRQQVGGYESAGIVPVFTQPDMLLFRELTTKLGYLADFGAKKQDADNNDPAATAARAFFSKQSKFKDMPSFINALKALERTGLMMTSPDGKHVTYFVNFEGTDAGEEGYAVEPNDLLSALRAAGNNFNNVTVVTENVYKRPSTLTMKILRQFAKTLGSNINGALRRLRSAPLEADLSRLSISAPSRPAVAAATLQTAQDLWRNPLMNGRALTALGDSDTQYKLLSAFVAYVNAQAGPWSDELISFVENVADLFLRGDEISVRYVFQLIGAFFWEITKVKETYNSILDFKNRKIDLDDFARIIFEAHLQPRVPTRSVAAAAPAPAATTWAPAPAPARAPAPIGAPRTAQVAAKQELTPLTSLLTPAATAFSKTPEELWRTNCKNGGVLVELSGNPSVFNMINRVVTAFVDYVNSQLTEGWSPALRNYIIKIEDAYLRKFINEKILITNIADFFLETKFNPDLLDAKYDYLEGKIDLQTFAMKVFKAVPKKE